MTTAQAHSGIYSALAGNVTGPEPLGDSSFYQQITVPSGSSQLSFSYWPYTVDSITFDWQDVYVTDSSGTILATVMHVAEDDETWKTRMFDTTPYAGQTVRIKFLSVAPGRLRRRHRHVYVDDVCVSGTGHRHRRATTTTAHHRHRHRLHASTTARRLLAVASKRSSSSPMPTRPHRISSEPRCSRRRM